MFVVDNSWTGPDILLRFILAELSRTCPSLRYGMGADTSGRLLRRVNALVMFDIAVSDVWSSSKSGGSVIDVAGVVWNIFLHKQRVLFCFRDLFAICDQVRT